jgi:hypothetical protein
VLCYWLIHHSSELRLGGAGDISKTYVNGERDVRQVNMLNLTHCIDTVHIVL